MSGSLALVLPATLLGGVILWVAAQAGGWAAATLRQPRVVGYLAAGLLLGMITRIAMSEPLNTQSGPDVDPAGWVLAATHSTLLKLFTQASLVIFVALTARDLMARPVWRQHERPQQKGNLDPGLGGRPVRRLGVSTESVVVTGAVIAAVPLVAGIFLAWGPLARLRPPGTEQGPYALFMGLALAASALPVISHMLKERRLLDTETDPSRESDGVPAVASAGTSATTPPVASQVQRDAAALSLGAAAVADAIVWAGLALALSWRRQESVVTVAGQLAILVVVLIVGRLLTRRLAGRTVTGKRQGSGVLAETRSPRMVAKLRRIGRSDVGRALGVFVGLTGCSLLSDHLGYHVLIGAFLFGAFAPWRWPQAILSVGAWSQRWLLPVFFTMTAASIDLTNLTQVTTSTGGGDVQISSSAGFLVGAGLLLLIVGVSTKVASGRLCAWWAGLTGREAWMVGVLVNCRGMTELVLLQIGLSAGLIDAALFGILVLMALATTALTSPMLSLLMRAQRLETAPVDDLRAEPGSRTPGGATSELTYEPTRVMAAKEPDA